MMRLSAGQAGGQDASLAFGGCVGQWRLHFLRGRRAGPWYWQSLAFYEKGKLLFLGQRLVCGRLFFKPFLDDQYPERVTYGGHLAPPRPALAPTLCTLSRSCSFAPSRFQAGMHLRTRPVRISVLCSCIFNGSSTKLYDHALHGEPARWLAVLWLPSSRLETLAFCMSKSQGITSARGGA